jgi:predicted ArsR family transcriptional regulator
VTPTPATPTTTDRQRDVLRLVHEGKTLREIADALAINSVHGVECHIAALVRKGHVEAGAPKFAKHGRWRLTAAGLAVIGLRECGACCGSGTVSLGFGEGKAATRGRRP